MMDVRLMMPELATLEHDLRVRRGELVARALASRGEPEPRPATTRGRGLWRVRALLGRPSEA